MTIPSCNGLPECAEEISQHIQEPTLCQRVLFLLSVAWKISSLVSAALSLDLSHPAKQKLYSYIREPLPKIK